jgi:hypothetical protein
MKKLPDRPGDVKVDAAHAATLVAARSVSSVAWEHDGERGHRRSLIQAFVGAIKDRVSKPPASFDPVCPGVEAFRRLGTCPSRRATHKRQRRPSRPSSASQIDHPTGRGTMLVRLAPAPRAHRIVLPDLTRRSRGAAGVHIPHGHATCLRGPRPRTHSPFHRCDDLSLNEKPLLKTL